MKIAVTGASGFIGRAVVAQLASKGHHVRALSRSGQACPGAAETAATGDLVAADPAPLVAGCDAVIHCAARVHVLRREAPADAERAYRAMNQDLPLALARTAREGGAARFVQISSAAAIASTSAPGETVTDATEPRPRGPYGRSKLAADEALAELAAPGFAVVSLRPPTVYGPGVSGWFALYDRAARLGVPLPLGRVENRRSFAFIGNIASAIAAAAEGGPSGAYLVTDSEPVSSAELYRRLLALHGKGNRILPVPAPLVRLPARLVLRERADSLLGDAAFDGSRFAARFGWSPQTPLDEALALTISAPPCSSD